MTQKEIKMYTLTFFNKQWRYSDITLPRDNLAAVATWKSLWLVRGSLVGEYDEMLFALFLCAALTAHPFLHSGEGMSHSHIAFSIYPLAV